MHSKLQYSTWFTGLIRGKVSEADICCGHVGEHGSSSFGSWTTKHATLTALWRMTMLGRSCWTSKVPHLSDKILLRFYQVYGARGCATELVCCVPSCKRELVNHGC